MAKVTPIETVEEKKKRTETVKLVRSEIIAMYNGIKNLPETTDIKTAANIAYNRRTALLPIVQMIQEITKAPPKLTEYEEKRVAVCHKHALRTDKGDFQMDSRGSFMFPEDKQAEVNTELESLAIKYKEVVDAQKNKQLQLAEYMLEKEEVEFRMIPLTFISKAFKAATPDQLDCLMAMTDMDK